ncbi:hypothetical protein RB201_14430 [Streptomyces sp. S1A(2023)]
MADALRLARTGGGVADALRLARTGRGTPGSALAETAGAAYAWRVPAGGGG